MTIQSLLDKITEKGVDVRTPTADLILDTAFKRYGSDLIAYKKRRCESCYFTKESTRGCLGQICSVCPILETDPLNTALMVIEMGGMLGIDEETFIRNYVYPVAKQLLEPVNEKEQDD